MNEPQTPEQILAAAREMLNATKQSLQVVDAQLSVLQGGRIAVTTAGDVSSEHRVAFFSAVDVNDEQQGIELGDDTNANNFGFQNPKAGLIRIQEDAAFVCTDILVAVAQRATQFNSDGSVDFDDQRFFEAMSGDSFGGASTSVNPYLRLTDKNTGREFITGMSVAPVDQDRGVIPFTYLSSIRRGLGANVKNRLFSELTMPRASVVKAEVFNMASPSADAARFIRAYVTLLGFKVFGA